MKTKTILLLTFLPLVLLLSACTGSSSLTASSWPGVTIADDQIFLAFGPHVYSLDIANGSENWKFPVEADNAISFYSPPALTEDGSELIIGGYDKVLYSLDPETGASSGWSFTGAKNRYIGGTLVTAEGIFAPNSDGYLYAVDFKGLPLWPAAYNTVEPQWSKPSTDGQTIYIAALDHQIHAVDIKTGKMKWSKSLDTASTGTPTVANGTIYAGTFGSKVIALDAATGNIRWQFETQDWVWASPAVTGNLVIAGDISGILYAINAETGKEVWRFTAEAGIFGTPLVLEDHIYFGVENGKFYALTLEGDVDWFYSLTGKIYSTPIFTGENLLVAAMEGENLLTAISLSGTARWTFNPEK